MSDVKSYKFIIIRGIFAFIALFLVVEGLDYLNNQFDDRGLSQITEYVNLNLDTLIILFAIAILAQLINTLKFPLNLPAPILKAIPIVYIVKFCSILLVIAISSIGQDISKTAYDLTTFVNPIIFVLILVLGYLSIFGRLAKGEIHNFKKKEKHEQETDKEENGKSEEESTNTFFSKILNSLRDGLYHIFKFLSDILERGETKK